ARTEGRRSDAIRAAGRALALDPSLVEAGELVAAMVTEVPPQMPPEVESAMAALERQATRARSYQTMFAYLAIWCFAPFLPLIHVASWPLLGALFGVTT